MTDRGTGITQPSSLFLFLRQKAQFIPDGFRDDDGVWHVGPHQAEYLDALDRLEGAIHAAVSFTYIDTEAARLQARVDLKRAAGWPLTDGEMERLALLRAKVLEAVTKPDPETPDFEVDDGFGI